MVIGMKNDWKRIFAFEALCGNAALRSFSERSGH
jgi:hypothetical protein